MIRVFDINKIPGFFRVAVPFTLAVVFGLWISIASIRTVKEQTNKDLIVVWHDGDECTFEGEKFFVWSSSVEIVGKWSQYCKGYTIRSGNGLVIQRNKIRQFYTFERK